MPTARDIIELSMKEAGVLGVGQTLLAEDINDGLTYLQRLTDQWQKRRWLIPALETFTITCTGQKSYTIGPTGNLDIVRPPRLNAVYVIQRNTGQTPVSLPLAPLFSYEDYALLAVKDLHSLPDHFFYDAQWPLANFYPWPIPDSQYDLYLIVQKQLAFPLDSLDTEFDLPDEYLEAIHYNLAIRLCSAYTLPVGDETRRLAKSSLNTIRTTNAQIPRMGMPGGLKKGKAFSLWNPDGY